MALFVCWWSPTVSFASEDDPVSVKKLFIFGEVRRVVQSGELAPCWSQAKQTLSSGPFRLVKMRELYRDQTREGTGSVFSPLCFIFSVPYFTRRFFAAPCVHLDFSSLNFPSTRKCGSSKVRRIF